VTKFGKVTHVGEGISCVSHNTSHGAKPQRSPILGFPAIYGYTL